ncbi:hypothetical protein INS49_007127 [Diaporthe citri]|uniref:uncharacterized protein n=1 Tax=Diaporthe citri TaxID=83186 RepID=UPI001C7F6944|nr:uncharacterized protein INS49_007127 [Diaporthe citri]KAG6365516.1 hypothetical protein INS49_007127 [Diaporthe citri]
MSSKQISPLLQTWYKWKALRLPWRKRFLAGLDLQGNTYWEFRDVRGDPSDPRTRWRRIVQYPRDTHYSEHAEVRRQHQMRLLAAEADARWAAKPSLLEHDGGAAGQVGAGQPVPALGSRRVARGGAEKESALPEEGTRRDAVASGSEQQAAAAKDAQKKDPWAQSRRGGPSEDWQPQAWSPPASKR